MPSDIAKYAGYYGVTNQQMKVDIKDGELSITVPMVPDYPAEKYVYTADGTFVSADGDEGQLRQRKNDRIYVWVRQYVSIPGLGQMALSHYTAEKMEANPLSKETAPLGPSGRRNVLSIEREIHIADVLHYETDGCD